jgi:hypothetical protein
LQATKLSACSKPFTSRFVHRRIGKKAESVRSFSCSRVCENAEFFTDLSALWQVRLWNQMLSASFLGEAAMGCRVQATT